jgi:hypothetical protein
LSSRTGLFVERFAIRLARMRLGARHFIAECRSPISRLPGLKSARRRLPLCAAFALSRPSGGRFSCEAIA